MIWLLLFFRSVALALKRAGKITGATNADRRVFLQTVTALGGAAALGQLAGPMLPVLSRIPTSFREVLSAPPSLEDDLIRFTFDGLFSRDVQ